MVNMHTDAISSGLAESGLSTGSLLSISPLAFSFEGMYSMLYWYADSTNARRCIRAAAIDGIPVLGSNYLRQCTMICPHGEWSPYEVLMELLHTIDDSQVLTFDLE